MLGLTCDLAVIPLLAPFLDIKDARDDQPIRASALEPVAVRVCDVAYDAIRTVRGEPEKCIRGSRLGGVTDDDFARIHARRDEQIATLKAQLDKER